MQRLKVRALPPFGGYAVLGVIAVASGLALPQAFGNLAGRLLTMQFLVVIFMVFLLFMTFARHGAMGRDPGKRLEVLKLTAWLIDFEVAAFFVMSLVLDGIFGPLEFLALVGATFLGALRGERGPRELFDLGVRCGTALIALAIVQMACSLPEDIGEWPGHSGSVLAAGLYFGGLAVLELTPFHRRMAILALQGIELLRKRQAPLS